jgi:predicted ATPase/DNA-binding SARP family transcriptional activator
MQAAVGSPGSSSPTPCRIQLLGELRVTLAGSALAPALPRKIGGLLGYLACFLHRSHPRDLLIELFWPDVDVEAGRASLRSALPLLRRLLEPPGVTLGSLLLADRQTVRLDPERVTTDVAEFEWNLQAATRAASPGEQALLLERALSSYGGELLPGYYEPWVLTERERLAAAYVAALRQLAAARVQQGDFEGAIDAVRRAVHADPLEEAAHFDLIQYYAAAGQMAAARRHYRELERLLKAEMEITPSRSLQELLEAGERMSQISLPAPAASASPERAPPAPRLLVPPLPVPLTPFFGREEEIAQVGAMLENSGTRLVTLTGLGGTGKTRLALEVARRLQQGSAWEGVVFVSLVDLADPRLLLQTFRAALNLPATSTAGPLEQVATALGDQHFLLVLDNFEQLLDGQAGGAEGGPGPGTFEQLLVRAPGLVCLVTSRRPLGLMVEREYPVAPLPTPAAAATPERLLEFASVRLFVNRAQAARSDFQATAANGEAVTRLCQALEGIPLALELAAARSSALTPAQMLEHLSDRFGFLASRHRNISERHRTLRAALEWSYQALPEELQRLLARLSVFRGGWTLEAAEAVCGEDGVQVFRSGTREASDGIQGDTDRHAFDLAGPEHLNTRTPEYLILDSLLELRDASLVIAEEAEAAMRFRMLETVREYVGEQLARSGGEEGVQRRHATYFLELAEASTAHLSGPDQAATVRRLEREHDNVRTALAWARTVGEDELRADLACSLHRFWNLEGHGEEARRLLEDLRAKTETLRPSSRARLLGELGRLHANRGDFEGAENLIRQSLALYRELGDTARTARALNTLGHLVQERDLALARGCLEESLILAREAEDEPTVSFSLLLLSILLFPEGEKDRARALLAEAGALCRRRGDLHGLADVLVEEGGEARESGDQERARACLEENLALRRQIEDRVGVGFALAFLARLARLEGRLADAARDYEGASAAFRASQWDHTSQAAVVLLWLIWTRRCLGDHEETGTLARQSLRIFQDVHDARLRHVCVFFLADAAARRREPVRAAQLLGILTALGVPMGEPGSEEWAPFRASLIEESVPMRASLITELGESRFAEEERFGQTLPADKAMVLALEG